MIQNLHASWCPWCRRLEKLLDDPTYGPKFRASYVIAAIDIREWGEKQSAFTPADLQDLSDYFRAHAKAGR